MKMVDWNRLCKHLLVAFSFLIVSISHADGSRVYALVHPTMASVSVQLLSGEMRSGSGVINANNEVLTNCHVIDSADQITVRFSDGVQQIAKPKGRVAVFDICALSVATGNRTIARVASLSEIRVGQAVYAVGDPLALRSSISSGIVSAVRQAEGGRLIQVTTPISPGSSGGGLFDEKGRLLGLTTFMLAKGQNLNFAIPAEYRNVLGLTPFEDKKEKVTFKGIPFGSTKSLLKETFAGTSCNEQVIMGFSKCVGGPIDFLGWQGAFEALFLREKLHSVSVKIPVEHPDVAAKQLQDAITRRFGEPASQNWGKYKAGTMATWTPNNEMRIDVSTCLVKGTGFLDCQFVGVSVGMGYQDIAKSVGPSRDF